MIPTPADRDDLRMVACACVASAISAGMSPRSARQWLLDEARRTSLRLLDGSAREEWLLDYTRFVDAELSQVG